jgi:prepilin-type N-terminal cleavage/methylation domain-containing protein
MRKAFTLIEILISIMLLSLVLIGLYDSLDIQRNSNKHLFEYLQKALNKDKTIMVLFNDLMKSDGNITIKKSDYDRLCINSTTNSLYALPVAKVCWVVIKEKNQLVRVEGSSYELPVKSEDRVAVDRTIKNMKIFDTYYNKKAGKILVVAQQENGEPYTFLLRGIYPPQKKKASRKRRFKRNRRRDIEQKVELEKDDEIKEK